jgi:hypothetical protein
VSVAVRLDHEELFDRVESQVRPWSAMRREQHGFGLLVGDEDEVHDRRRAHARTVLVGETILEELRTRAPGPLVLMKGLEVAQLYPAVTHRPFRDLDLLVTDARATWDRLVAEGYWANPRRPIEIDHHHLPALAGPHRHIGLELHHRPNLPAWATIPTDLILSTAEPSRTDIEGILRPRDDLHALLMAMHGWKGGFTRLRDLFDALLLAAVSEVPVEETAARLGLTRFWRWTSRIAENALLGRSAGPSRFVARVLVPGGRTRAERKRVRLVAPYLVANPIRVTRGHLAEYRLGQEARRQPHDGG